MQRDSSGEVIAQPVEMHHFMSPPTESGQHSLPSIRMQPVYRSLTNCSLSVDNTMSSSEVSQVLVSLSGAGGVTEQVLVEGLTNPP